MNSNCNEVEINLTKNDTTPLKSLTRSMTKASINSPVKHTISSLNKAKNKEITISEKKGEDENGKFNLSINMLNEENRFMRHIKSDCINFDGTKTIKSDNSPDGKNE
jgi:hypothetical protein